MFRLKHSTDLKHDYQGMLVVDFHQGRTPCIVTYGECCSIWAWANHRLRDIAPPQLVPPHHGDILDAVAADFDCDGNEELLLTTVESVSIIKSVLDQFIIQTLPLKLTSPMFAWDRRGNGKHGFASGKRFFEFEGRKLIERFDFITTDRFEEVLLIGPIVSQGRPDVLVRMNAGNLGLFVLQAQGQYAHVGVEYGLHVFSERTDTVTLVDSGDPNMAGLFLTGAHEAHRLLIPTFGTNSYKNDTAPALAWPSRASSVCLLDEPEQGAEIVLLGHESEPSRLHHLRTGTPLPGGEEIQQHRAAVTIDLDDDDNNELVTLGNTSLNVYEALSSARSTRFETRNRFGAPALGSTTTVEILTDHGSQSVTRRIIGRSEKVASFGIRENDEIVNVTTTWPDGSTTTGTKS